jgi:hypothetical protein
MSVYDDLLVADFSECFEQMRHYQEGFLKRLDFGFGGIVAVIAATAVLIEHFRGTALILALSGLLLLVSTFAGALLVVSLARNRVYFAFVARYVNEIRALYLSKAPGGIENKTGIYVDHTLPKMFDIASSQTIDIVFLSICVSILASGSVTCLDLSHKVRAGIEPAIRWPAAFSAFGIAFLAQLAFVMRYWGLAESSSNAHKALHERKQPRVEKQSVSK